MIATLQQINIAMAKIVFPQNLSAHGGFLHSFASLLEAIIIALAIGWATHDGMMMTMTMMTTMTMMMCLEPKIGSGYSIQQLQSGWLLSHLSKIWGYLFQKKYLLII